MKYKVNIQIKDGVLDPEMETLQRLLKRSGVTGIAQLTHTQTYELTFAAGVTEADAEATVENVAGDVLANPEIHDWQIERA